MAVISILQEIVPLLDSDEREFYFISSRDFCWRITQTAIKFIVTKVDNVSELGM